LLHHKEERVPSVGRGAAFPADRSGRHAARDGISCVQKAHRLAAIGMLLRQYGHSRVFARAGVSVLRRFISALTGRTTKKKTTAAIIRNETTALMKSPTRKRLWLIVKPIAAKSGLPPMAAIRGGDKVLDEGGHYRPKRRPDDDTDRQINDITPKDKCLEVIRRFHRAAPFPDEEYMPSQ